MAFEIIKAEVRVARMVQWFTGICTSVTDLVVGSKMRTKFEAIGVEMEEQDYQFFSAVNKAIPVAVYQAFEFPLLPPVKASGVVTFTANPAPIANIIIPAGAQIATVATATVAERVYATTEAATILAGQTTVSVNAACISAGAAGNAGAGTITVMKSSVSGVTSVTNAAAFSNGQERETEPARRGRFRAYIAGLSKATDAAIEYGAKTANLVVNGAVTERVVSAKAITTGAATGNCVIYNGAGTASNGLIARAQEIIDGYTDASGIKVPGYKAAGVVITVVSATVVAQAVSVTITLGPTASGASDAAESAILAYFSTLGIGDKFVFAEIVGRIMAIEGVTNCSVTVPAADVVAAGTEVFAPGTITVTVA